MSDDWNPHKCWENVSQQPDEMLVLQYDIEHMLDDWDREEWRALYTPRSVVDQWLHAA